MQKNGLPTKFYQIQTKNELQITPKPKQVTELKDAWSVITLENIAERSRLNSFVPLLNAMVRLIISSGHIYWLKLSMGEIDLYTDPVGGEKLYEMFACTVAQQAGCKVTDLEGPYCLT
ncbi:MAG: hypothetical protein ABII21_02555 [bacterium]